MTELIVRQATEQDVAAIVQLWREMADLHAEIEPMVWTLSPEADERCRQYLRDCIESSDCRLFVAVDAQRVVGYLLACKAKRPPVLVPPEQGAIQDACVTRSARRKGIGTRLVAAAMEWFRSEELTIAAVSHALGNDMSSAFWRAQGFRPHLASCVRPIADGEE
jgi:ribosomal protein S18 acetylase RimI-like enzyme